MLAGPYQSPHRYRAVLPTSPDLLRDLQETIQWVHCYRRIERFRQTQPQLFFHLYRQLPKLSSLPIDCDHHRNPALAVCQAQSCPATAWWAVARRRSNGLPTLPRGSIAHPGCYRRTPVPCPDMLPRLAVRTMSTWRFSIPRSPGVCANPESRAAPFSHRDQLPWCAHRYNRPHRYPAQRRQFHSP